MILNLNNLDTFNFANSIKYSLWFMDRLLRSYTLYVRHENTDESTSNSPESRRTDLLIEEYYTALHESCMG